jgi:hypothetical protein
MHMASWFNGHSDGLSEFERSGKKKFDNRPMDFPLEQLNTE